MLAVDRVFQDQVKQHRQGEPFLVEGKNKEIVMTLREIAANKVRFDNIDDLPDAGNEKVVSEEEPEKESQTVV